ncbi:MAG: citrate synthase/methylcitrate synthase [Proteobacteria bacterium]|nr:citrate synthase/methylcitrate synthase [Pseudomonadota bacterium]
MENQPLRAGLEGVVVAETAMSRVDGERGELLLHGHDVREFAGNHTFEETCALLWTGQLPDSDQCATIAREIADGRERAFESLPRLGDALAGDDGMDALRAAMSHWRSNTANPRANGAEIAGALATFAAAWWRKNRGQEPIAPDRTLSLAADYLRMLAAFGNTRYPGAARDSTESERTSRQGMRSGVRKERSGRAADASISDLARALDTYFVTVIDHGMNASTFAARVVTSTGSDVVSAMVAALGALKGPRHGGAPGPVLDMLDAIGRPERASAWLDRELAAGRRIMGMGHRVYRVRDPRAAVLQDAAETLCAATGDERISARLALARAVESRARELLEARYPDRRLRANVEFYTAVLLDAIRIDRRLFTPTFAIARSAGWFGHITEQAKTGRLIRPKSRYVGPDHSLSA